MVLFRACHFRRLREIHLTYSSSIRAKHLLRLITTVLIAEGIVPGINNDWLISEEYGPSIWSVDKTTGNLRWRYTPYPIAGPEIMIDTVFKRRRPNRGFEALGQTPRGRIITILQSPAYNPTSSAGDASQIHRIIEIDQKTGATRQFAYLHQAKTGNLREKDWKIGDIAAINDYEFLIIEHALRNGEDSKKNL